MLKELKSPQKDSTAWCSFSDKLQMAEDSLAAVRKVRREVVDCMRLLMKLAKEKKTDGMFLIVQDMLKKTKLNNFYLHTFQSYKTGKASLSY